jgi:hypothetical protein
MLYIPAQGIVVRCEGKTVLSGTGRNSMEAPRPAKAFKAVDPTGQQHELIAMTMHMGYPESGDSPPLPAISMIQDKTTGQAVTHLAKGCYRLADGTNLLSEDPTAP